MKRVHTNLFLAIVLIVACDNQDDYVPKKKSYPRISFPERAAYQTFSSELCPFTFEVPDYVQLDRDSMFFHEMIDNPCWYNAHIKSLNATLHLTYFDINSKHKLQDLLEDMHEMTFTHTVKADYIDKSQLHSDKNVNGLLYSVGGNAASPFQFYLTDSVQHFVRGSVYINTAPNIDSLKPVIEFVENDMMHLIETFRWNNSQQ